MAISETVLKDTVLMAIDEINAKGGVLGKKLEPVVVDPASNWPLFAEKTKQLLGQDKVSVIFGCWTSVSRKSVLPVVEEMNGLAAKPKLLILDEPTEGIQPSIIKDIGRVIRRLADEGMQGQRMAVLLCEQYYDFAEELADAHMVMERGEVIAKGPGKEMQAKSIRQLVAI
jgi:ABC-type microcin C transport system duplicated ATPase subunit YejF